MYLHSKEEVNPIDYTMITTDVYKITFRENITNNGKYFSYDEYSYITEIKDIEDIQAYIKKNYKNFLEIAKINDAEKQKENKINSLKTSLDNSDYKVIKTLENFSLGLTLPYDYSQLITKRQSLRDEINNIESNEKGNELTELAQAQARKINELCSVAQTTITNGIDFGKNGEHYRLTSTDQINLTSLYAMAQAGRPVPYHADGEVCRIYQPEEMIGLVQKSLGWITYHTTYFNLIKHQVMELETIEEVESVVYGMELKQEYQEILNMIIQSET